MRRSELDPRVVDAAFALCGGAAEPVLIGRRAARVATQVGQLEALPAGAQLGCVWWWCEEESAPLVELRRLRQALRPGAVVLALADDASATLERLRAFVGAKRRPVREPLCSAFVLAGFLEPAASVVQGVLLVRAWYPSRIDALDEVFAQPAHALAR